MNGKLAYGLAVGLLVGIGIASLHRPEEVHAQNPQETVVWEYKVVAFVPDAPGPDEKRATEQFNKLAADGWQYVGLLTVNGPVTLGRQNTNTYSTVLFKRQK